MTTPEEVKENIKKHWPEIKKNILKRRKTKAQRTARKKQR